MTSNGFTAADVLTASVRAVGRGGEDALVGLRRASPDSIHDVRVAMRTLRSLIDTFEPFFEPEWARMTADDAAHIGAALGPARDAQVAIERLGTFAAALGAGDRIAARPVLTRFELDGERAVVRVLAAMLDPEYHARAPRMLSALHDPRFTRDAQASPAPALFSPARRTWNRFIREAVRGRGSPAAMHHTRIRAKAARYALEAIVPVAGPRAERLAGTARKAQTALGDYRDLVTLAARLKDVADDSQDARTAFAAGLMCASARAAGDDAARRWARFARRLDPSPPRWLRDPR